MAGLPLLPSLKSLVTQELPELPPLPELLRSRKRKSSNASDSEAASSSTPFRSNLKKWASTVELPLDDDDDVAWFGPHIDVGHCKGRSKKTRQKQGALIAKPVVHLDDIQEGNLPLPNADETLVVLPPPPVPEIDQNDLVCLPMWAATCCKNRCLQKVPNLLNYKS